VILIATTNVVLVRKEIHPALIDLLAQTIAEVHGAPGVFQRAGEFPTQTDPEFPVAEEALDFYKNGPSLLNRYLHFWITNYVKRAIAVLFSYAPRLYKWLVEHRLRVLYRRLRIIEANSQKSKMLQDIVALEGEIESLDRETLLSGAMRHSAQYFAIKSHLHLVHNRIQKRRAELSTPLRSVGRRGDIRNITLRFDNITSDDAVAPTAMWDRHAKSEMGQWLHFCDFRVRSVLLPIATVWQTSRQVGSGPIADMIG
jgi:hypothetical protein